MNAFENGFVDLKLYPPAYMNEDIYIYIYIYTRLFTQTQLKI